MPAGSGKPGSTSFTADAFGKVDPILGRDIGFYIFKLPLLEHLQGLLFFVLFLTTALVFASYLLGGEVALDPVRGLYVSTPAMRHVGLLVAAFLLVLAFGAWLQIPQSLTTRSGVVSGASYVDVHARMPALRVLVAASILAALDSDVGRLHARAALAGSPSPVAIYLVAAAGRTGVRRDHPALRRRAERAGARDAVHHAQHRGDARGVRSRSGGRAAAIRRGAGSTRADLDRNQSTIENVPLWNDRPLLDTFSQIQEIRTYYDFVAVDNDRYTIDGKYRQIMLSARELNSQSLPSRTWINEHLTFTHGYGLTLGPVNEVTREGLPVLFIRDLPPVSTARPDRHPAGDLLRRAAERSRLRQHQDRGVRLSARRRQRLHERTRAKVAWRCRTSGAA